MAIFSDLSISWGESHCKSMHTDRKATAHLCIFLFVGCDIFHHKFGDGSENGLSLHVVLIQLTHQDIGTPTNRYTGSRVEFSESDEYIESLLVSGQPEDSLSCREWISCC